MPAVPGRQGPGSSQVGRLGHRAEIPAAGEVVPDIGRPFPEMPDLRELVIAFGDSGYVAFCCCRHPQ